MPDFTADSLPKAIRSLFELNQYEVSGPLQVHGAEVDLVARPKFDPFGKTIYIEATIEHVDNDKYGKDVGKLAMLGELERDAQRLIVSSKGFSLPVKERAEQTRILTWTYDELFRKFQQFDNYITEHTSSDSKISTELLHLNTIYEEPLFDDRNGKEPATEFLSRWRTNAETHKGWLIIAGEYGTGKTALTKVLQYRWLQDYRADPTLPIPFRIELRNFSRQFDARGLLHHFLDHNALGHIPIDFVESLIRTGKVLLLLDGYDEMAQYLTTRERRVCLEALAALSAEGARGILTSRPNYFTEAEELHVFEILYSSLEHERYFQEAEGRAIKEREEQIDKLLGQFLERYERTLKDLTEEQTESLVRRILSHDSQGCEVVLGILRRITRRAGQGETISLSGKPVIISYLFEVVEQLKHSAEAKDRQGALGEWQIYEMILDKLMLRDYEHTPEMSPVARREFLRTLSVYLSRRDNQTITEEVFRDLIRKSFQGMLRHYTDATSREELLEKLFASLRRSTTLTSGMDSNGGSWRFSHSSLREFLLAELMVERLEKDQFLTESVPVTDAMRVFAASRAEQDRRASLDRLTKSWGRRLDERGIGQVMTLLWESSIQLFSTCSDPVYELLMTISGERIAMNGVELSRIVLSCVDAPTTLTSANFSSSTISAVDFTGAKLSKADFSQSLLEGVRFVGADLREATFTSCLLVDVDFTDADVQFSDFRGIEGENISILIEDEDSLGGLRRLVGIDALAYLSFQGATTEKVPENLKLRFHPNFAIAEKIIEKISQQSLRQRRGLTQRGAARQDVPFARDFIECLQSGGYIRDHGAHDELIEVTEKGREFTTQFAMRGVIPDDVMAFLRDRLS